MSEEKGSMAIITAFMVMLLVLFAGSAYSYLVMREHTVSKSFGDGLQAQYAAEAGIRYAFACLKQQVTNKVDPTTISLPANEVFLDSSNKPLGSFLLSYTKEHPEAEIYFFTVTSIGKAKEAEKKIVATIKITIPKPNDEDRPPTTKELILSGKYSKNKPWIPPGKDGEPAKAPDTTFNQVLFNDSLKFPDKLKDTVQETEPDFLSDKYRVITLTYDINLKQAPQKGPAGYGIYYCATGEPDNMSAYVIQYDPGVKQNPDGTMYDPNGSFLVKKLNQRLPALKPGDYGYSEYGYETRNYQLPFKGNPQNNPLDNYELYYMSSEKLKKLPNPNDWYEDRPQETLKVTMGYLEKLLEKVNGKNFAMKEQTHRITISMVQNRKNETDIQHIIKVDGVPVLYFKDYDTKIPPPPKEGSTTKYVCGSGLRVWNADVDFYNIITQGNNSGQKN